MSFSAVVSLLDKHTSRQVEACWDMLEHTCGLKGIRVTPYPHISWQVARQHEKQPLFYALARRAASSTPFVLRCSGLGIFSGPEPVLYLNVVKNEFLLNYHHGVWEETGQYARGLSPNYHPNAWIPHITLAYRDITADNIGCALKQLAFSDFDWQIRIDNLAVVIQAEGQVGEILRRFDFQAPG